MRNVVLAFGLVVAAGVPALGHHSFAAHYFEDQSVTVEGTLVELAYRAPHAWVYLDVEVAGGDMQRFAAEWSNPRRLARDGITAETLAPGERVIVTGSPGRTAEERTIHLKRIERPSDGWSWQGGRRGRIDETRR